MIHSTIYNKNTNEYPKTSTIFEHLVLLPDNVFYSVIHKSIRTFKNEIPKEYFEYREKGKFVTQFEKEQDKNNEKRKKLETKIENIQIN